MGAYKKVFLAMCDGYACKNEATYHVHESGGRMVPGQFCDEHADQKIIEVDRYDEALKAALER